MAAGAATGGHADFAAAQKHMAGLKAKVFRPDAGAHETYRKLFALYRQLHDAFGTRDAGGRLHNVMKDLIAVRAAARGGG